MKSLWQNRNWGPMLLKEIAKPFDSKDYIYELKFDGIRAICFASPTKVTIISRNQKDITHLFPELQEIKQIVKHNVIFDGEIIALEQGKPSFSKIQKRIHAKSQDRIQKLSEVNPIQYMAFDIVFDQKNLIDLSLMERKKILNQYRDLNCFVKVPYYENNGIKLFQQVKKRHLEGIVAKLKYGKYYPSCRTSEFIKIKNIQRAKFYVGGYNNSLKKEAISLALGEYRNNQLYFVGKVTVSKNKKIYQEVKKMRKTKSHFVEEINNLNFVKPIKQVTIEFLEKTKNNHLRHPVYKG